MSHLRLVVSAVSVGEVLPASDDLAEPRMVQLLAVVDHLADHLTEVVTTSQVASRPTQFSDLRNTEMPFHQSVTDNRMVVDETGLAAGRRSLRR